MKNAVLLLLCLFIVSTVSGCVKTYTYQVERQDQDLVGNKGIVKGEVPPDVTGRKRMRTMGGLDVEMPAEGYKERKEAMGKGWLEPAKEPAKKTVTKMVPVTVDEYEAEAEVAGEAVVELEEPEERSTGYADEQWVKKSESIQAEMKDASIAEIKTEKAKATIYTIRDGDTLEKVAKKFLGDASRWPEIYEANKNVIEKPSRIFPGQVIVIPENIIQGAAVEAEAEEDSK